MPDVYSPLLNQLIEAFQCLPGVGSKTAQRMVFHLLDKDREGGELSNISPRRYFCMQCHVPQTDAKPLVGNRFESAVGVR